MPEFLQLSPPAEALDLLLQVLPDPQPVPEAVDTLLALGRVTALDVVAPHPLPAFPRSTVDGYAVRAADTYGVSESQPAYLRLAAEVPMGAAPDFILEAGNCGLIHTGGMLPAGADAVVMLEYCQCVESASGQEIELLRSVAVGENVLRIGEDVAAGQVVLPAGTRIRPAEIGGCMALGIVEMRVARKPRVGIISSGDEVVPPEQDPDPGQVRDVNSYALAAMVNQAGGEPRLYGIVPDHLEAMKAVTARALEECDLIVVTAGSSASARDMTAEVLDSLGEPGVLVHGVNVRPGKPTILAVCDGKAAIGLPGNPVSALVIAGLFISPLIDRLLRARPQPKPCVAAVLTVNVPSQAGREDWIAVHLRPGRSEMGEGEWAAEPVFGKSNLIFTLAAADGLVRIPPEQTGLAAGEIVLVTIR
ncbi:MAG: molybdopterin molybdenumtransferase MoeA [Anaerolineales bacterium]|nr:molybdopterin molybdenumtransferase MoeA [Anaerolineales bacterium]